MKHLILFASLAAPPSSAQTGPRIEAIDAQVPRLMEAGHFPGLALAVLQDGEPVHIGTYGMASLEHGVPVGTETVFELASLTKQMTALLVLSLFEARRLSLDTPIRDYVEDAPEAWSAITVDQLLSHTGGLEHRFEPLHEGEFRLSYTTESMLAAARATPLRSQPGSDWHYSDQGYFLLGLIIEAVSGQSYDEALANWFFEPLKMRQTRLLDQSAIIPQRAEGYAFKDGAVQRNRRVWQFGLTSHFGVMSSLEDMLRWEAALVSGEHINSTALQASWELQRPFSVGQSCESWGYARGWWTYHVNGERIIGHGGHSGTAYLRAVDRGLSVIVLTNREDTEAAILPMAVAWASAHAVAPDLPAEGLECWQ